MHIRHGEELERSHCGMIRVGTADAVFSAMKLQRSPLATSLVLAPLTLTLTGCELIGSIFKAGVWVGVLGVFAVVALVVWGVRSLLG